jgi:UDPglucose--hexose-1-phosphate uridylyltransferase
MPKIISEIRKSYFLNKYVIITPGRARRPRDIHEKTMVERTKPCVFCPENVEKDILVKQYGGQGDDWNVLVLKNKYPAVTLNNKRAYGTQEVIVETPIHGLEFGEINEGQIEKILRVYAERTAAISKIKRIEYILVFKNNGSKAGASILHAHSQIFATDILPVDVYEELKLAKKYKLKNKTCPYCDILKSEIKGPRKIYTDKYIAAFAPYASEFHYEAWIFTKRHLDNITRLSQAEFKSFAKVLKKILLKLHLLDLSYNFFMHQVVSEPDQHFYLKIQPRESIWAGIELGSGIVINSISPEVAAAYYQK